MANKGLANSNYHLVKNTIQKIHGVKKSSRCEETLEKKDTPKLTDCEALFTSTNKEESFVQRRLSDCTNHCFSNVGAKRTSSEIEEKDNDSSIKPVIIHLSGIKVAERPPSLDGSYNIDRHLDINTKREEELNTQETLQIETMRKRFAEYTSCSGSESSVSDSEHLDLNSKEKDSFQMTQNIQKRGLRHHRPIKENDELDKKYEKISYSRKNIKEVRNKISNGDSKFGKECYEEIQKCSETESNSTERNINRRINRLTPVQGLYGDAFINTTIDMESFRQEPVRCTLNKTASSSREVKKQAEINSNSIYEKGRESRKTFHIQNERETLSNNTNDNRCLEEKTMVPKHISQHNSGILNKIDLMLLDECPEEEINWITIRDEGNFNSIDKNVGEDPMDISPKTNSQSFMNVKINPHKSDITYFSQRPSGNYESRSRERERSRSPRYRKLEDHVSDSCNSDTSPVRKDPKPKHSVLHAKQRKSGHIKNKHFSRTKDRLQSKVAESTYKNNAHQDSKHQSQETTHLRERESGNEKSLSGKKRLEDDDKLKTSCRRNSRQDVSLEKELRPRETLSPGRASRYSKSQDCLNCFSRRSISSEKVHHSFENMPSEKKFQFAKSQESESHNSGRSVFLEKEHCSRERTSEERAPKYSKSKESLSLYSKRSISLEKEHHCQDRMSPERRSKYAKSRDSLSRYSRRNISVERDRRSQERTSLEKREQSKYAKNEQSKKENDQRYRFQSPVSEHNWNKQERSSRRIISDGHDYSWVNSIVVKIAEPRRGPIRKGRNPCRRSLSGNSVERSNKATEEGRVPESFTKEDRTTASEDGFLKRKKRWTFNDYIKQNDGTLNYSQWKRYDNERTMPYQGYADSQVHSLLKQLCGDFLTKLYSKQKNFEDYEILAVKDHRAWFMSLSEWICYGDKASRPQVSDSEDHTTTRKDTSTKEVSLVWHTVPLLTNAKREEIKDVNKIYTKNTVHDVEDAVNNKFRDKIESDALLEHLESNKRGDCVKQICKKENRMQQAVFQEELSRSYGNLMDQNQTLSKNKIVFSPYISEENGSISNSRTSDKYGVGSEVFTPESSGQIDFWNISSSYNEASLRQRILAKNDFLVTVTPSSYWYEDSSLKQREKALKVNSTASFKQSVYTPTSFSTSRPTGVLSTSVCFHFGAFRFDLSQLSINSSDVDGNNRKNDHLLNYNATTPQSENGLSKIESSLVGNSAKRQLNFDDVTESLVSKKSKINVIETDENSKEMFKDSEQILAIDSAFPCAKEEFVSGSSTAAGIGCENLPVNNKQSENQGFKCVSFSESDHKIVYLQKTNKYTVNEDASDGNVGTTGKDRLQCGSEVKGCPKEKKPKDHLSEKGNADKDGSF